MIDYYLFSTLKKTENIIYDLCIILFLVPFFKMLTEKINLDQVKKLYNKPNFEITYEGYNFIKGSKHFVNYSNEMLALFHYINNHKITTHYLSYESEDSKYQDYLYSYAKENTKIACNLNDIQISDKIYFNVEIKDQAKTEDKKEDSHRQSFQTILKLKTNVSITHLEKFIQQAVQEYEDFKNQKYKDKLYHFLFQGMKDDKPQFTKNILSDRSDGKTTSFETFNTLFTEHKNRFMKDIDRLKNVSYFQKSGGKRKLGYLFYGVPGCGKTSSVTALANYDKRHIIEIPMSRIKKNLDIESILNLTSINEISFNKSEIILLFDEIDQAKDSLQKRDSEGKKEDKDTHTKEAGILNILINEEKKYERLLPRDSDQLNLGFVLSRLDGIGNYDGLVMIATTNCIDDLSPALYRHGRLSPVHFDYMRKIDIVEMIEYFYDKKLTNREKENIPDKQHKITPVYLKQKIEENEENLNGLLSSLAKFRK